MIEVIVHSLVSTHSQLIIDSTTGKLITYKHRPSTAVRHTRGLQTHGPQRTSGKNLSLYGRGVSGSKGSVGQVQGMDSGGYKTQGNDAIEDSDIISEDSIPAGPQKPVTSAKDKADNLQRPSSSKSSTRPTLSTGTRVTTTRQVEGAVFKGMAQSEDRRTSQMLHKDNSSLMTNKEKRPYQSVFRLLEGTEFKGKTPTMAPAMTPGTEFKGKTPAVTPDTEFKGKTPATLTPAMTPATRSELILLENSGCFCWKILDVFVGPSTYESSLVL